MYSFRWWWQFTSNSVSLWRSEARSHLAWLCRRSGVLSRCSCSEHREQGPRDWKRSGRSACDQLQRSWLARRLSRGSLRHVHGEAHVPCNHDCTLLQSRRHIMQTLFLKKKHSFTFSSGCKYNYMISHDLICLGNPEQQWWEHCRGVYVPCSSYKQSCVTLTTPLPSDRESLIIFQSMCH